MLRASLLAILLMIGTGIHAQTKNAGGALEVVERLPGFSIMLTRFNDHYAKDSVHAILYIDGMPQDSDTYRHGYYSVYVGESHTDHTVRWYTFLVSTNLKRILYYDIVSDRTYPVDRWRSKWPATQFLKRK